MTGLLPPRWRRRDVSTMTAAVSADRDSAEGTQMARRERERGQRWRCLVAGCPTKGEWQREPPGEPHLLPPDPNSHYMRNHYQAPLAGSSA